MIYLPKNQFKYYYNKLNGEEKKVYTAFLQGVCSFTQEIAIKSSCSPDRIREIYDYLFLDVPDLFFLGDAFTGHLYEPTEKEPYYRYFIKPKYRYNETETISYLNEIRHKTALLLNSICRLDEYHRIAYLHDYLVRTIIYDEQAKNQFDIVGAFLNHHCVCSGVAKAFKYIADRTGLSSLIATGDVKDSNGLFYQEEHAWNIVSFADNFYHTDVTFDNTLSTAGSVRYDYFLLSDSEISDSHSPSKQCPSCPRSYGYYKRQGLCFPTLAQAEGFIRNEIYHKQRKRVVFQLETPRSISEKKLTKDVQQMLQNTIFASNEYRHCQLNSNYSRGVFQVTLYQ